MTDPIRIEIHDAELRGMIRRVVEAAGPQGLRPALLEIGEDLTESTQRRFATSTAPDGSRWLANARATIEAFVNRKGTTRKDGRLNAKGSARAIAKKPLVDSGDLRDDIHKIIDAAGDLVVGTNRFAGNWEGGAAVLHFGSRDGHIPARPILGVSAEDRSGILEVLNRHFRAAGGA